MPTLVTLVVGLRALRHEVAHHLKINVVEFQENDRAAWVRCLGCTTTWEVEDWAAKTELEREQIRSIVRETERVNA